LLERAHWGFYRTRKIEQSRYTNRAHSAERAAPKEAFMKYFAAVLFLSTAVTAGCGSDAAAPPKTPTGGNVVTTSTPTPPPVPPEKAGDVPTQSNINISDEIRKACGITDAEAFFSYDSANVRPQDKAVLKKLADCFMTGPLKGRELRLVGHADPRGEEEYNMVLGGRRADNVKSAIANEGMTAEKIATTSRGKLDATGTDEASWAKDRRVDVVLGR
jgi:peptidoglycan-associated lipoprotein